MSKTVSEPTAVKADLNGRGTNGSTKKSEHLPVMKTYKIASVEDRVG
jgi:hypothetical protein